MPLDARKINAELRKIFRDNTYRGCYVVLPQPCLKSPIKAHSISKAKHLASIAAEGKVNILASGLSETFLVAEGKMKAGTFPGFCDDHDKIFQPIDERDYVPGNRKYEFLCAMRASARELYAKATQNSIASKRENVEGSSIFRTKQELEFYQQGTSTAVQDLKNDQLFFNHNLDKSRFDRIRTVTLCFSALSPIVVSSMFLPQIDFEGNTVNDLGNLNSKAKQLYVTVLPQNDSTYVLLSYKANDEKYLGFIGQVSLWDQQRQKIFVSNIMAGFMENFAVSPPYWGELSESVKERYQSAFLTSMTSEVVPFIIDDELNIF